MSEPKVVKEEGKNTSSSKPKGSLTYHGSPVVRKVMVRGGQVERKHPRP